MQNKQIKKSKYINRGMNVFIKYSSFWQTIFHLQRNKKTYSKKNFLLYNKIEKFLNKDLPLAEKHFFSCFSSHKCLSPFFMFLFTQMLISFCTAPLFIFCKAKKAKQKRRRRVGVRGFGGLCPPYPQPLRVAEPRRRASPKPRLCLFFAKQKKKQSGRRGA